VDAAPSDYHHAIDLVHDVVAAGFCVGVAAHPEVHPQSRNRVEDRRLLAEKMAIADFAVTQLFFDVEHYTRLVDELAAHGCTKPIVPGIMPVTNLAQVQRMANMSGAKFPDTLTARLEAAALDGGPDAVRAVGRRAAIDLCQELLDAGAPGLHFYTLNRSTATREIYAELGLPVT
jgi:methylenetetrahydrofolate reductase (NADPH)